MRLPGRGAYLVLAALPQVGAYVLWPIGVAQRGKRYGWRMGRPGPKNLFGLLPISAGAILIGWAISGHDRQRGPDVTLIPDYLVTTGAYSVSRNPLYVGGVMIWLGWALLFGNARVACVGGGWCLYIRALAVPLEERLLHNKFGDAYDAYTDEVRRWIYLGKPNPKAADKNLG